MLKFSKYTLLFETPVSNNRGFLWVCGSFFAYYFLASTKNGLKRAEFESQARLLRLIVILTFF